MECLPSCTNTPGAANTAHLFSPLFWFFIGWAHRVTCFLRCRLGLATFHWTILKNWAEAFSNSLHLPLSSWDKCFSGFHHDAGPRVQFFVPIFSSLLLTFCLSWGNSANSIKTRPCWRWITEDHFLHWQMKGRSDGFSAKVYKSQNWSKRLWGPM